MLRDMLAETRISLDEITRKDLVIGNPSDLIELRGRIAESLAKKRLEQCRVEFDEGFPREADGYLFVKTFSGIQVLMNSQPVHEFDFLFSHQGKPYVAEVKSMGLNGFLSKVDRAMELSRALYGKSVEMLLFLPINGHKASSYRAKDVECIGRNYPGVYCIDLCYKRKDLERAVFRLAQGL